MGKELTAKQKLFCKYYAVIGSETIDNGAQSAIKAGYSEKSAADIAWQLLEKEGIRAELDRIAQENAAIIDLSPLWIKNQCYLMYERAKAKGDYVSAKQFLELAGKCVGAFTAQPDSSLKASEPATGDERRQWLEQELRLLDQQDGAGDGLPKRAEEGK